MWLTRPGFPSLTRRGHGFLKRTLLLPPSPTPPPTPPAWAGGARITAACSPFTSTASPRKKVPQFPARPRPPPEEDITEAYLKGSGPGGQKIVRFPISPPSLPPFPRSHTPPIPYPGKPGVPPFLPTLTPRPDWIYTSYNTPRLTTRTLCPSPPFVQNKTNSAVQLKHIPTGIVVKCQDTRSRSQNRKLAREHLAEKIDDFLNGENSRSAIVARMKAKKKASAGKKSRRKHNGPDGETEQGDEVQDENLEEDGIGVEDEQAQQAQQAVKTVKTVKIQEVRQG